MSVFYCEVHDTLEDSDYVGYNVVTLGGVQVELCDNAADDLEFEDNDPVFAEDVA